MAITVKQLIEKLKELDQNAPVVIQNKNFDQDEFEGHLSGVVPADESLLKAMGEKSVVVLEI